MAGRHDFNQTVVNATCKSVTTFINGSWTAPFSSLPFVCRGVEHGSRTWRGVFCYPFWGYGAAEMLVLFCLLLWWRAYSREKAASWRGHEDEENEEEQHLKRHESQKTISRWFRRSFREKVDEQKEEPQQKVQQKNEQLQQLQQHSSEGGLDEPLLKETSDDLESKPQLTGGEESRESCGEPQVSDDGTCGQKCGSCLARYGRKCGSCLARYGRRCGRCLARSTCAVTDLTEKGLHRLAVAIFHILVQTFQWWVVMTILLVVSLFLELQNLKEVYISDLSLSYLVGLLFGSSSIEQPDVFKQADQQMQDYVWKFSVYSIVALILIYVVCIICIFLQAGTHVTSTFLENPCALLKGGWQNGRAMMNAPRDVAISVLLLPMVYGFLSLRSVLCMWSSVTGQFTPALTCDHWHGDNWSGMELVPTSRNMSRDTLNEVYESNFALADVYESYALYMFAIMLGSMLEPSLNKAIHSYAIKAFADIMATPVFLFVVVLGLNAIMHIFLAWSKWRLGIDMCEVCPTLCLFQPYYSGANWCVSFIAVYNLVSIETKFHHWPVMQEFGPFYKFAAIKAMVTVSFSSPIILGVAKNVFKLDLTDSETKLLDSSFRIYVMAIVALVNVIAWWPWMAWYGRVSGDDRQTEDPHGAAMIADKVPSGTICLVQELLCFKKDEKGNPLLTEAAAEDFENVSMIIDKLDETETLRVLYHGSQLGWGVQSRGCIKEMKKSRAKASSVRNSGLRNFFAGNISDADDENPKALFNCTTEERKLCLKCHLRGFYPDTPEV